ncbi:MAG: InlB B-repeat-containing protein, partial [Bacteroidaceae bacterium]|nr:InlB B-repeat-containing protein [Bacteroidaceae bacterium]
IVYGDSIPLIDNPVKEGYTFKGWSDAPATMPAEDVTISGAFAVNYYKVTYIVDKEIFATDSVAYGSGIKLIAAPEKEGYTFYGWSDAPTTMPAADVTINGSFEVNTYAVTYIVDGNTVAVDSVAYGAEITPIAVPVKEGYTFSGWGDAPATMPANDIVISGSFEINTYVVTYLVDGKTFATDSIVFNSDVNVISAPEKEGYTFSGWSYAPKKMPAEDIVISGTFSVNYYTITYLVDGEEYKSEQVAYGTEIKLLDAPEKEGRTFSGWSYAPKKMPAENITISGSFSVNYYTITYIVDGVAYDSLAVAYGSEITLIAAPEKEGYTFSGWSDAPATMPAEDIIITGSFVHTSINSVSAEATVKVNGNIITLVGADGKAVAVYSTNGALVEKIDSYADEEIALDKGVYIVRVGGKTVKVKL